MVNVKPLMSSEHPEDKVVHSKEVKPCNAAADDSTKDLIEKETKDYQRVEKIKKEKKDSKKKKSWIKRLLNII